MSNSKRVTVKRFAIGAMLLATGLVQAGNPVENAYGVESIKLGGILGDRLDKTVYGCLMKVDFKKDFLPEFLPENRAGKNGHSYVALGKSMIAADYFAAYTGDPEVLALKNEMIQTIIQTQDEDGYIGTFKPGKLRERNKKFGYHETCYIAHGLSMNYKIFGDEASLKAAEGASGWQMDHFFDEQSINKNVVWPCLWGFEESLMNLYALNQDPEIIKFMNKAFLPEGNLANVWKAVTGQNSKGDSFGPNHSHAYNYLSTALGMEKLNLVQPDEKLTQPIDRAIEFWKSGGSTAPGAYTWSEGFNKYQGGRSNAPNPNHPFGTWRVGETCATAYQLLAMDFRQDLEPDAWQGDLMERVIYNIMLGGQSKDGRHVRYGTPVEGPRFYHHTDNFCCPNSFRMTMAKVPGWFYYTTDESIYFNLYGESETVIDGMKIVQKTNYPFGDGTVALKIGLKAPLSKTLRFRVPAWTENVTPSITVNGKKVEGVTTGTIVDVQRTWKDGDTVVLKFPIENRWLAGRDEQFNRATLMRGPVLYGLNPVLNNIEGYEELVYEEEAQKYSYWKIISSGDDDYSEWYEKTFSRPLPDIEKSHQKLQNIRLQMDSVSKPFPDSTFFENGEAVTVYAWDLRKMKHGFTHGVLSKKSGKPPLKLTLTTFADAGVRKIYFLADDLTKTTPDEVYFVNGDE